MKMDGSIVIGTAVDDSGIDKGIDELKRKVDNIQEKVEVDIDEENGVAKLQKFIETMREIVNENKVTFEANLNNHNAVEEANKIFNEMQKVVNEINNEMEINPNFDEVDLLKYITKIDVLSSKLENLGKEKPQVNFSGLEQRLDNIGNKIESTIGKIGRWALSLFSVATAFSIVSRASSTALNQNEALADKIAGIWNYLAELVMPIMENVINWILKALAILNYFLQCLTGINFAAKANERALANQRKATEKQTRATKKQAQAQKELNKELVKFDEMTKLSDEKNTGADLDTGQNIGGAGTIELPELDENTKSIIEKVADAVKKLWKALKPVRDAIKNIIDWCLQHPDIVLSILGGVALIGILGKILGVGGVAGGGLLAIYAILLSIAAISAFAEIAKQINDLNFTIDGNIRQWKLLEAEWDILNQKINNGDASLENFDQVLKVNTANVGKSTEALADNIAQTDFLKIRFDILTGTYGKNLESLKENINAMVSEKDAMFNLYNQTEKNEGQTIRMKEYLERYKESLEKTNEKLSSNSDLAAANSKVIKANKDRVKEADLQIKYLDYTLQGGTKSFEQFSREVDNSSNKVQNVDNKISNLNGKKATVKVDADTSSAERKTNNWFSGIANVISSVFSPLGLVFKFPRLATGGIINMPGRGVPVGMGRALGGENGAEGVIPLTDSQQMELLGEAIGKYITVNNVLNNYMNGRLISRELQKSDNESDFAFNR